MTPSPKAGCARCYGSREVTEPEHDFTFMKKLFKAAARQVACPVCSVVMARGVRTHSSTGQQSIVPLRFECHFRENRPVVAIVDGGVTGYETIYFDDHFLDWTRAKGWLACAGTPDRYDSLFVPAKEMRAVFEGLWLT